jgi:hypothetical protein
MPTAEDFDAAATAFDAAAQTTGTLVDPARALMGGGVMVGGQLTDLVTDELDSAAAILDKVTAELSRLAEVCRERAETCREALTAQGEYDAAHAAYRADLHLWQVDHDAYAGGADVRDPGPPPDPPVAPPSGPDW